VVLSNGFIEYMKKTLTLVIPTYNMERYLNQCLSSLIISPDQMSCLEVLVINDGSKDNSLVIAKDYEVKYPDTFRVVDKENGNYGSCVNRGLKEASGKYIKILDADDSFNRDNLDQFIRYLGNIDADMVISDIVRWNEDHEIQAVYHFNLPTDKLFGFEAFYPKLELEMHAITYKVDLLRTMSYVQTEGISYTDTEWDVIPLPNVKSISYFPKVIYYYLVGREGQTINADVYIRNYDQLVGILKNLLIYLNAQTRCEAEKYIFNKLGAILGFLYRTILLYNKVRDDNTCLVDFDIFLKDNNKYLYDSLGDLTIHKAIPYRFIAIWRKQNYHKMSYIATNLAALVPVIRKIKSKFTKSI